MPYPSDGPCACFVIICDSQAGVMHPALHSTSSYGHQQKFKAMNFKVLRSKESAFRSLHIL